MTKIVMRIFKNILDLIFVPKCGACFSVLPSSETVLCDNCGLKYQAEKSMKCGKCGYPRNYCKCTVKCEELEIPLIHVTGYSVKRDAVGKQMVLHIKDDRLRELIDMMAHDMSEAFKFRCSIEKSECRAADQMSVFDCNSENTCITWIPRSKRALRRAGHDQSKELAKRISTELGFPLFSGFINIGNKAQKKLNSSGRRKNASSSYHLSASKNEFFGKTVIIIDDIVTTGASLGTCAEILMEAGAKKVAALTFAQTESWRGVYNDYPSVR